MAGQERADDGPQPCGPDEIVLWVRLTPGERFTGVVGCHAPHLSHRFSGWIDFMGSVNALLATGSGPAAK
jgi:hypothetical protein